MERRRERSVGIYALLAALIVSALAVWLMWTMIVKDKPNDPTKNAVLVYGETEAYLYG